MAISGVIVEIIVLVAGLLQKTQTPVTDRQRQIDRGYTDSAR
jgi:hypothetical protein